jgi:hypothetical protein
VLEGTADRYEEEGRKEGTIYMYISVHKKNPIKIGEGKN